ncbi:MAG: DUF1573 domain-containing protein [Candidatus Aureabacteria bacterium]|nr:DUF1573 domain-containing protein [Candidatus Auribacterota bacterium]
MRLKIFVAFILFLFPFSAYAVEISPQKVYFGDVKATENSIAKEITIKNDEKISVVAKNIRTSCDCLVFEFKEQKIIKPNETFKFTFKLNPAKLDKGKFRKYLFFEIKNSEKPLYVVEIHGNIL